MKKYSIFFTLFICLCYNFIQFDSITFGQNNTQDTSKTPIKIAHLTTTAPLHYLDEEDEAVGIAINILHEISDMTGIPFEFVPFVDIPTTEEEIFALNEVDAIASLSINENYNTEKFSEFKRSSPYYHMPLSLTGIRDFHDDTEMLIGIFDFFDSPDNSIKHLIPDASIMHIPDRGELEASLYRDDINFIFTTTVTAQAILRADTTNRFQRYPFSFELPLALVLSNDFPEEYEQLINEAIAEMNRISKNRIILKDSYDYSLDSTFMRQNNLYNFDELIQNVLIAVGLVLAIVLIIFMTYKKSSDQVTYYDKLTGFYTEHKFNMELSKLLAHAKPNQYSILSIDIDNFKYINEMYEFAVGNEVLKCFAEYLKKSYPNGVCFARVHADNFFVLIENDSSVIIPNIPSFDNESITHILGDLYHIYTSAGIYYIEQTDLQPTSILNCVTLAKNFGKEQHGNSLITFNDSMDKLRRTQNKIVANMEIALKTKEFEVYYQPKVDLKRHATCGAEALIRWKTASGEFIFPDEFIPLFEKNRYITKLDFYVFEEVCQFIKDNPEQLKDLVISVNLSTVTLMIPDLCQSLLALLKQYSIDIKSIELEITESAFVENLDFIISQVKTLKQHGFSIALDDFGSGISSLNQLKNIDLDVIKLDKAFLSDSLEKNKGIIVIENVVSLAKDLGLKIVAEGVETKNDCDILYELDCDIIQGYYFGRPMPEQNFKEFLTKGLTV